MNNPETLKYQKILFGCLLVCGTFMTYVSFVSFLGSSSEPSDQKWAALACCVLCAAATFILWIDKDRLFQPPFRESAAEELKAQSIEGQRHHWQTAIWMAIVIAITSSIPVYVLGLLLVPREPSRVYFSALPLWIYVIWYIFRSARELAKLRSLIRVEANNDV